MNNIRNIITDKGSPPRKSCPTICLENKIDFEPKTRQLYLPQSQLQSKTQQLYPPQPLPQQSQIKIQMYCKHCEKNVTKSNWSHHCKTKKHIRLSSGKCEKGYYYCNQCNFKSKYRESIYSHKKLKHDNNFKMKYKYRCKLCKLDL